MPMFRMKIVEKTTITTVAAIEYAETKQKHVWDRTNPLVY